VFACRATADSSDSPTSDLAGALGGTAAPSERSGGLAPLADAVWLERVPLAAGHEAFVSIPLGATSPRPIMVGMHGAGDRPEWACGGYRTATEAFAFIICPRGTAAALDKFDTPSPMRIEEDVRATVALLRARFGRYVAEGPLIYAGFSLGASHGSKVLVDEPGQFPVALLIEGGYTELTPEWARRYAGGGGRRVMLGCGQPACPARFAPAARALVAAGIDVRILDARTGRHNLDGAMMTALHDAWGWLVADDARWRGW
jgi:predicted esterase